MRAPEVAVGSHTAQPDRLTPGASPLRVQDSLLLITRPFGVQDLILPTPESPVRVQDLILPNSPEKTPLSVQDLFLPNNPEVDRFLFEVNLREAVRDRAAFVNQAIHEAIAERENPSPVTKLQWDLNVERYSNA